ncbi:tetratricopeptide repeat protein [Nannocystis bainbridge]|uniref:Tetratricopeptide repeat protein n=1 Tax=Nannocystis bainbridge TaxID=2995303 RepID=A0ABT5E4Z9_9BACT|nr:tetratricopeptide repeat protein [Nannocystis bainbridge]MDC0720940.1 tetratricopeptide repeat protein [Nannocystis bainbridge]
MDPQNLDEEKCRDLVAAYRRERMPTGARADAWVRLQAAIADEEVAPQAAPSGRRRDLVWGAVLVAAAVLILIVGARERLAQRAAGDPHSQAAHDAAATGTGAEATNVQGEPRPRGDEAPATVTEPAALEPAPESRPRPASPRAADVPKDMPALDAELALLRTARAALGRKDPAAALTALEQHARGFPSGHLVEERMLLRAQAQCELGQRDAARATAAELVRTFPDSPHARTVAGLCAD